MFCVIKLVRLSGALKTFDLDLFDNYTYVEGGPPPPKCLHPNPQNLVEKRWSFQYMELDQLDIHMERN